MKWRLVHGGGVFGRGYSGNQRIMARGFSVGSWWSHGHGGAGVRWGTDCQVDYGGVMDFNGTQTAQWTVPNVRPDPCLYRDVKFVGCGQHPVNIGGANPNPLPKRARDCVPAEEYTAADFEAEFPVHLL